MLSFRPLKVTDFPLLLSWLSNDHVKQWWNDGDNTLEKVVLHYGAEEPDLAKFILIESTEAGENPLGYFQYYIVSKEIIGIDQFIGEVDRINKGIGTVAVELFLQDLLHKSNKPRLSFGQRENGKGERNENCPFSLSPFTFHLTSARSLQMIVTKHKPQQIIIDPHPENKRAIRCYKKVGFVYYATDLKENGESAYMMRLNYRHRTS